VLILSGFLRDRFAQKKPLNLTASVTFEQSYSGIDGDSASSTELYALMSSLSGLPIEQGIAVTGSVNQHGDVQPIGGVNQKVEGFFKVCKAKGLTGSQGVMIPRTNVGDLMLEPEVVDAVRDGRFHLWAVDHIDQGIEVLTGVSAGGPDENGDWPEGTVNFMVNARLEELSKGIKDYESDDHDEDEKESDKEEAGDGVRDPEEEIRRILRNVKNRSALIP
jgi:predicted ATP-dependent protease